MRVIDAWRKSRGRATSKTRKSVAKARRTESYRRTPDATYRVHVSDAGRSTWATWLTQMTSRQGWSVARLARESGIHRSTIFRWIKGDGGLTLQSVESIARALDVPMRTAVLAAGNMVDGGSEEPEADEEIRLILAAPVDEPTRKLMLQRLADLRLRDQQRRLDDLRWMIDRAKEA
jgi:transcriptional regulator with XRE-family HTH domain